MSERTQKFKRNLGAVVLIYAAISLIAIPYWVLSGKFPTIMFIMPVGLMGVAWLSQTFINPRPTTVDLPELEECVIDGQVTRLAISVYDNSERDYPKPTIVGNKATISRGLVDTLSADALQWLIRTQYISQTTTTKSLLGPTFVVVIVGLMALALFERFHASAWWLAIILGFICIAFWFGFREEFKREVLADKSLTVTESDLLAAKEALSHVYFSQKGRPFYNKYLFSNRAILRRAQLLGITLEQGYQVPNSHRMSFSADGTGPASEV